MDLCLSMEQTDRVAPIEEMEGSPKSKKQKAFTSNAFGMEAEPIAPCTADAFDLEPKPFANGGFGSVWRGNEKQSGRAVAIKKVEMDGGGGSESSEAIEAEIRVMRQLAIEAEIRVMRQLDHPCIIKL